MRRIMVTVAVVGALLMTTSGAATARNPVTRGDVQAQFQGVETGGEVIRMKQGFATTIPPANGLIHSIRPIQPFFNDLHYCELDWQVITIALGFVSPEDLGLSTVAELKQLMNAGQVTFELDDVEVPAEEDTAVKVIATTNGDQFWKAWGVFYPPGALSVGSHTLTGFAVFPDIGFPLDEISFHIDAAGEGICQ